VPSQGAGGTGEGSGSAVRVLVVGRIRFYREGLALVLAQAEGLEVVGTAADSEEAFACAERMAPDVALVEVASPGAEGVAAVRRAAPGTRIVLLSVPDRDGDILACAEFGIDGFVTSEASLDDVVRTVGDVAHGEMSLSPRLASTLLRRVGTLAAARTPADVRAGLTVRELDVAALLGEGLSNKEIARRLRIELPTVKNHVHNILEKLELKRRGEVAGTLRRRAEI